MPSTDSAPVPTKKKRTAPSGSKNIKKTEGMFKKIVAKKGSNITYSSDAWKLVAELIYVTLCDDIDAAVHLSTMERAKTTKAKHAEAATLVHLTGELRDGAVEAGNRAVTTFAAATATA